jgi:hypothetical protein
MPEANGQPQVKFEQWAVIELMGHQRIAGFVTEATIAGGAFIRVDVPKPEGEGDLYTRYLGPSAIYAINPTTKEEVLAVVGILIPKPPTPRVYHHRLLIAGDDEDDGYRGDDEDDRPW